MDNRFEAGCEIIWKQCMGLHKGERALVVTDNDKLPLGQALYQKALELEAEAVLLVMPVAAVSGAEPPAPVAAAMLEADVIVCPTAKSITHTNARIQAVKKGARIATMPGITEEMFSAGPITADYGAVEQATALYTQLLTQASVCRIVTGESGQHELILGLEGRNGVPSPGVYRKGGQAGNLPSGEAYIAPLENGADGTILIDGSIVGVGLLTEPVVLTMEGGRLTAIAGKHREQVEGAIPDNELSRTIGELGIGTNPNASITGVILEDEKIYGSIHVAFGTNTSFGGSVKAPSHIDCVTLKPTVYLDGKLVVERGRLVCG